MKKKHVVLAMAFSLLIGMSQPLIAAKKPNARKGKYLFRKHCRTCHVENGSAVALSPISKTQAEWTKVFKNGAFQKLACKDQWAKRSEKDLADLYVYMHNHAYDSPSPMKCK